MWSHAAGVGLVVLGTGCTAYGTRLVRRGWGKTGNALIVGPGTVAGVLALELLPESVVVPLGMLVVPWSAAIDGAPPRPALVFVLVGCAAVALAAPPDVVVDADAAAPVQCLFLGSLACVGALELGPPGTRAALAGLVSAFTNTMLKVGLASWRPPFLAAALAFATAQLALLNAAHRYGASSLARTNAMYMLTSAAASVALGVFFLKEFSHESTAQGAVFAAGLVLAGAAVLWLDA